MPPFPYAYTSWTREYLCDADEDIRELDVETRYPESVWSLISELISIMLSEIELQIVFWIGPPVRMVLSHRFEDIIQRVVRATIFIVLIDEYEGSSPGIIGEYALTQRVTLLTLEDLSSPDSW